MDSKLDGRKKKSFKKKRSKADTPALSRYILALKGNKMTFKMEWNDEFYLFFPTLDADREKKK